MTLDNGATDGESDAHTVIFRGVERFEESVRSLPAWRFSQLPEVAIPGQLDRKETLAGCAADDKLAGRAFTREASVAFRRERFAHLTKDDIRWRPIPIPIQ